MILFFRIFTRVVILAVAYFFSTMAAMATLVVSIMGWRANFGGFESATPEEELFVLFFSSAFGIAAFFHIGLTAVTPAAMAGLLTEAFSWRSIFLHVGGGGVIGLYLLSTANAYGGEIPPQQDVVIALAAGFVAGFVYWLIAGRNAGGWRVKPRSGIIITETGSKEV